MTGEKVVTASLACSLSEAVSEIPRRFAASEGQKEAASKGQKSSGFGKKGEESAWKDRRSGSEIYEAALQRENGFNGISSEFYGEPPGNGFRLWKGQTQGDKARRGVSRERQKNREVQVLGDDNPLFSASKCKNLEVLCAGR